MRLSRLSGKQLKQYVNQYVAVTLPDKEIVASGSDVVGTTKAALAKGYPDAFVMKVFPSDSYYVGYGA